MMKNILHRLRYRFSKKYRSEIQEDVEYVCNNFKGTDPFGGHIRSTLIKNRDALDEAMKHGDKIDDVEYVLEALHRSVGPGRAPSDEFVTNDEISWIPIRSKRIMSGSEEK